MTRPYGYKPSDTTRAKISAAVRAAHERGFIHARSFEPPLALKPMYDDFCHRFGMKEARRLVEDHMRIRKIGQYAE